MSDFKDWPYTVPVWALDFVRAIAERPLWARLLFWIALGKHARKEFWGMVWGIDKTGYMPWFEYGLEEWDSRLGKMPFLWKGKQVEETE